MKTAKEFLIEALGNDINIFSKSGVDRLISIMEEYAQQQVKNLNIPDVVGRSEQLLPNPITDKEHKDLMKALYPKDKSKRFRR